MHKPLQITLILITFPLLLPLAPAALLAWFCDTLTPDTRTKGVPPRLAEAPARRNRLVAGYAIQRLSPHRARPWRRRDLRWGTLSLLVLCVLASCSDAQDLSPVEAALQRRQEAWIARDTERAFAEDVHIRQMVATLELAHSSNVAFYEQLGLMFLKTEYYGAAIQIGEKALELDPTSSRGLLVRGTSRFQCGKWELGLADLRACAERDVTFIPILSAAYHDYSSRLEFYSKDFEGALSALTTAIELNPSENEYRVSRAELHIKRRRIWEAIVDCNEVLRRDPHNAEARFLRGFARHLLGEHDQAAEDRRLAVLHATGPSQEPPDYADLANQWERQLAEIESGRTRHIVPTEGQSREH